MENIEDFTMVYVFGIGNLHVKLPVGIVHYSHFQNTQNF